MTRTEIPGTIYIVCFKNADGSKGWVGEPGRNGAGHYCGFAPRARSLRRGLASRIAEHRAGRGSKLCAAAIRAGLALEVVRTWTNDGKGGPVTERQEKWLKDYGRIAELCPRCHPELKHRRRVLGAKQYRRPRPERPVDLAALQRAAAVPAVDPWAAPWPEMMTP